MTTPAIVDPALITPPAPVVPPPAPTEPWYHGKVSPEHVGVWQNKIPAADLADPVKVAGHLTELYRNSEKFNGVPTAELVRIPKPEDVDGTKAFWQKFGAPVDAAGYQLEALKRGDGSDLDPVFAKGLAEAASKFNIPAPAAQGLVAEFLKLQDAEAVSAKVATDSALVAETNALRTSWAGNWEANMFVAKQAATALGVPPEVVANLEKQIGYAKTMEFFRNVGTRIGEDKYVQNPQGGASKGIMTREGAMAKVAELKSDKEWVARYLRGDKREYDEMYALNVLITNTTV